MNSVAMPTMMSHDRNDWRTPPRLFQRLHEEFRFTVDAAASEENALLPRFWSNAENEKWEGERVWCNPPYNGQQGMFLSRAREAEVAVVLLPARTDTKIFHTLIFPCVSELRFLRGRLKFVGARNPAPFPSCLAIFRMEGICRPPLLSTMQGGM